MREMFEEYGRAVIAAIIAAGLFFVIGIYFTVTQTTPLWDALSAKNGMSISDTSGIAVDNRVPHIDIRNGVELNGYEPFAVSDFVSIATDSDGSGTNCMKDVHVFYKGKDIMKENTDITERRDGKTYFRRSAYTHNFSLTARLRIGTKTARKEGYVYIMG